MGVDTSSLDTGGGFSIPAICASTDDQEEEIVHMDEILDVDDDNIHFNLSATL